MKIAGFYLLGGAAVGFLLLASNIATVGPCTGELGAASLIAVVFGTPSGLILLGIVAFQHWKRHAKNHDETCSNIS
jgi:hypothetical protein